MVLKTNHLRTRIGIEDLKALLREDEKENEEDEKESRVILCAQNQIWLLVNENSATDLADTIFTLKSAIVVQLLYGVKIEYYYYKKRIDIDKAKKIYGIKFINKTEKFKRTYETYFKHIKKEEYAKKYAKLAEVLGEEKANYLLNTNYTSKAKLLHLVSIDGFFSNQYGDMAGNTTHEERIQLLELGIEVRI